MTTAILNNLQFKGSRHMSINGYVVKPSNRISWALQCSSYSTYIDVPHNNTITLKFCNEKREPIDGYVLSVLQYFNKKYTSSILETILSMRSMIEDFQEANPKHNFSDNFLFLCSHAGTFIENLSQRDNLQDHSKKERMIKDCIFTSLAMRISTRYSNNNLVIPTKYISMFSEYKIIEGGVVINDYVVNFIKHTHNEAYNTKKHD